jgi:hypothetical protein
VSSRIPVGTLVRIVGEDYFAWCGGDLGVVTGHSRSRTCDLIIVLVERGIIHAREDQLIVVREGE